MRLYALLIVTLNAPCADAGETAPIERRRNTGAMERRFRLTGDTCLEIVWGTTSRLSAEPVRPEPATGLCDRNHTPHSQGEAAEPRLRSPSMRLRGFSLFLLLAGAFPAAASDRTFVFSVLPDRGARPGAFAFTESSLGDPGASRLVGDGLEQRFGFQARMGGRFTILASALVPVAEDTRGGTTARAEVLVDLLARGDASSGLTIAGGGGVQREPGGVNVLLARGVFDFARPRVRTTANMVLEKPLADGRDAVDALTSVGVGFRLGPRFDAGVEMLAEDLEALWEADETEGGARLMIGPSLHYRTAGRLEANLAGGPIFLLRGTRGGSDALRALGNRSGQDRGYVVRASLAYRF